jgi:hypothetical protein
MFSDMMHPSKRRLLAMAAAALGLSACSGPPASLSYFPLEAGHRWVYDQFSEWENNTLDHEAVVLSTQGEESLESGGKAWRRRSETGVDYWLRSDDTGIYRVGTKTDIEEAPALDKTPRYVLKMPLAVGTTWQASTTTYLMRRSNEFPPEIRHTHKPVIMTYRIEAVGEKLTTRAGAFADCIRVQGTAVLKLFADPVVGFKDMPITSTEWYCKGVGLVKVLRAEPAQSTFLTGGTMTLELTEWQ